jgi:hypothetical protein
VGSIRGGLPLRVGKEGEDDVYPKMIFLYLSSILSHIDLVLSSGFNHHSLGILTRISVLALFVFGR